VIILCIKVRLKYAGKKTIVTVLLYGSETWSLALREEHRLRVFENRVLMRITIPKRDDTVGGWRRRHNDELHNLYASPNAIMVITSKRIIRA
jgi:hypothetical protein